jgi:DNA topoisomerase II
MPRSRSSPPHINKQKQKRSSSTALTTTTTSSKALVELKATKNAEKQKSVHDTYRKMSGTEHVLHRPELYVGMIEKVTEIWFVPHHANPERMVRKSLSFSPALFKIFDEILVNAADNKQRSGELQTTICVDVDAKKGTVSIYNDGPGIPIVKHKKHNMYIPNLIFGHLLTSSNYDDTQSKITGGRHGYGAKLTNVFSKEFHVETANDGASYEKAWSRNMGISHHELINWKFKGADFTRITFKPDVARFNMTGLDEDIVLLFQRRAFDVAATCGVSVLWNNTPVPVESFLDYALHFLPKQRTRVLVSLGSSALLKKAAADLVAAALEVESGKKSSSKKSKKVDLAKPAEIEPKKSSQEAYKDQLNAITLASANFTPKDCLVFHQKTRSWDVVFAFHLDGGVDRNDHVCFVNNVATHNGGSHLRHVQEKVIDYLLTSVKMQMRKEVGRLLRNMMQCFINAVIENPTFGSQIKDKLITPESNFHEHFEIAHKLKQAFIASNLTERIVEYAQRQLGLNAQKKAMRSVSVTGRVSLPKLEDANWAGSAKSDECTLILTEGDSAKALAVSGLAVVGRDRFGVFPLKGKLLNVREASLKKVAENDMFSDIMKAMGLRIGQVYDPDAPGLRYGRIMIMADQDADGSHIKGLVMNFIHHFWPSLLDRRGFLTQFITPIVKALPTNESSSVTIRNFFSLADFQRWRVSLKPEEVRKYYFKYYKGLGTSTAAEGREYFSAMDRHEIVMYRNINQPKLDDVAIELAFSGDQIEGRKIWVSSYSVDDHVGVDFRKKSLTFSEFIHKELILYSVADCERSIPSVIDGLKPSQRKILFASFKRNLTRSTKVEQLAGYISEHTAYHHGEHSLHFAIVGLAQDFVGSNNINLLVPDGQFGTRHESGKDHASARYIFTRIAPLTRLLFPPEDDALLKYRHDDGFPIEPHYFVPVIPTVLVNGASGIGTGFATFIPSYNPLDIIANIRLMLNCEEPEPMTPWYEGSTGEMNEITDEVTGESYHFTNNAVYVGAGKPNVIHIDDLAPGTSTASVKKILVDLVKTGKVSDFYENHTPSTVSFTIEVNLDRVIDEGEEVPTLPAKAGEGGKKDRVQSVVSQVLHELTKRRTTFRTRNMYGFDRYGSLRLFDQVEDILREHFEVRLQLYEARYRYITASLQHQLAVERSRHRFVKSVCEGHLKLNMLRNEDSLLNHLKRNSSNGAKNGEQPYEKHFPDRKLMFAGPSQLHTLVQLDPKFIRTGLKKSDSKNKNNNDNDNNNNNNKRSSSLGKKSTEATTEDEFFESHSVTNSDGSSGSLKPLIETGDETNTITNGSTSANELLTATTSTSTSTTSSSSSSAGSESTSNNSGYEYLMRMSISSFNNEYIKRLDNRIENLEKELEQHRKTSPIDLYLKDLDVVEKSIREHYEKREAIRQSETPVVLDAEKKSRKKKGSSSNSSANNKGSFGSFGGNSTSRRLALSDGRSSNSSSAVTRSTLEQIDVSNINKSEVKTTKKISSNNDWLLKMQTAKEDWNLLMKPLLFSQHHHHHRLQLPTSPTLLKRFLSSSNFIKMIKPRFVF